MFKSKIFLAALFFSYFQLNSINFRQTLAFSNIVRNFCTKNTLESSINNIKSQIRQTYFNNNQSDEKLYELEENISNILIKKYSENQNAEDEEKKLISNLEESKEMHLFAKYLVNVLNCELDEKTPTNPKSQQAFNEAKSIIKLNYNLEEPVYKIPQSRNTDAIAYTDILGNIYINENNFNFCFKTTRRLIFLHELVHKKRNHGIVKMILEFGSNLDNEQINEIKKKHETEADTISIELGNCYKCSEECSRYRSDSKLLADKGYLTKSQVLEIAKKQKDQNSLCKYHKNNQ